MRISVDILHPLPGNAARRTVSRLQTGKLPLFVILRIVKGRHVHAGQRRQTAQTFLLAAFRINHIQNPLHCFFALANDKSVGNGSQRLRIKGSARTADNQQRLLLVALCRPQLNISQIQHCQQIIVIHLKGQHDENHSKIRQRPPGFNTQKGRAAFNVFLLHTLIGQKETLAGAVPARVNQLI